MTAATKKQRSLALSIMCAFSILCAAAACLLSTGKPSAKAKSYTYSYEYLVLSPTLVSTNGAYDSWLEVRFYPPSGQKIYRSESQNNVVGNGAVLDFYPTVTLVSTEVKNSSISSGRKPAVAYNYLDNGSAHINDKIDCFAYVSRNNSLVLTKEKFFPFEIRYPTNWWYQVYCGVITDQTVALYKAAAEASYTLRLQFSLVDVDNAVDTYYGKSFVKYDKTFSFSVRTDKTSSVSVSENSNTNIVADKLSGVTTLKNNVSPTDTVVSIPSPPTDFEGLHYNLDSRTLGKRKLYEYNLRASNLEKNAKTTVVLEDGAATNTRTLSSFIWDTYAPNLTNASAVSAVFSNPAFASTLAALNERARQSFELGMTQAEPSFVFAAENYESLESAEVKFWPISVNDLGESTVSDDVFSTRSYLSGQVLKEDGKYELTIKDVAGNVSIYRFFKKSSKPAINYKKIAEQGFLRTERWTVKLPSGYKNVALTDQAKFGKNEYRGLFQTGKSYYFASEKNALDFAFDIEVQFAAIQEKDGFVYKLITNASSSYTYTDMAEFSAAVSFYSKKFVSASSVYKPGAAPYINPEIDVVLDGALMTNTEALSQLSYNGTPAMLVSSAFQFASKTVCTTDSGKIFESATIRIYDLYNARFVTDRNGAEQSSLFYGQDFSSVVGAVSGYFRIQEYDTLGNICQYIVCYDSAPPQIAVKFTRYGSPDVIERTITQSDVLTLYLDTFSVLELTDNCETDSGEIMLKVDSETNPDLAKIYSKTYPELKGSETGDGAGKYIFTVYDRSGNRFSFDVHVFGRPPRAEYSMFGTGDSKYLSARIINGESYNAVVSLKAYRNGSLLPETYVEYDGAEVIVFSPQTLRYNFTLGGTYQFELGDNFGRVSMSAPYKFSKGMPDIRLSGVMENGRTRQDVTISFSKECEYVLTKNDAPVSKVTESIDATTGEKRLFLSADDGGSGHYKIRVYKPTDINNLNETRFEIDKIAPAIQVMTEDRTPLESGDVTAKNVFITWGEGEDISNCTYSVTGSTGVTKYRRGELLTAGGSYTITAKDALGNVASFEFVIDNIVSYEISVNGGSGKLYATDTVIDGITVYAASDSFAFFARETDLRLDMTKDGYFYAYTFGDAVNTTGRFCAVLTDRYGNQVTRIIDIDKTPPSAVMTGAEEGQTVAHDVTITVGDVTDVASLKVYVANKLTDMPLIAELRFTAHGSYRVELFDRAGNRLAFSFSIDKEVDITVSIFDDGITNDAVKVKSGETLKIEVTLDGKSIEKSDIYKDKGSYVLTATDDFGNTQTVRWVIDNSVSSGAFTYRIPVGTEFVSLKNGGAEAVYNIDGDRLIVEEDGDYTLTLRNVKNEYRYQFVIDTQAPEATLSGVEDGGSTTDNIILSALSEECETVLLYLDGKSIDARIGGTLNKNGTYRLVLTDRAGNTREYTFTKLYKLNTMGILLIALGAAAVAVVILLAVKIRFRTKVK